MERYEGTAEHDGLKVTVTGSLQQVANWADNIIRNSDHGITINIKRIEEKGNKK